jgi:acetoacetyl-CoA synthetase
VTVRSEPLWVPDGDVVERATVTAFLRWLERERGLTFDDYHDLWRWSVDHLDGFWAAVREFFGVPIAAPGIAPLGRRTMPGATWFAGARLNYAEQVLAGGTGDRPALVVVAEDREPTEVTWHDLRLQVGAVAAALRDLGVRRGDRVAAYLPNIPEAVVALLAVTSIGAVWAACAPDFGARSVVDRFAPIEPKLLIAVDGYRFNGAEHDRRDVVADLARALPSVEHTLLVRSLRPGDAPPAALGATPFDELTTPPREPEFTEVDFDDPLWILFSSGTTGLPKGIVHGHGGIVLEHLKALGLCLDVRATDRWLFHSSTSWMAWNFLVGGLLHGATIVLYDGSPACPDAGGLWRVAARTGATILGMGSAYAAACAKAGVTLEGPRSPDALRTVIPTGSPLPPAAWSWLHDQLGPPVRIDSVCGGTDVCTAFFGGSPLLPVHAGEISCRWLGVRAEAWGPDGRPLVDEVGEFVVTAPMPSMPVSLWDDPDGRRYREAYFDVYPGVWRQGDWITITSRGSVIVWGRSDATLNKGGVRAGSAEVYGVVDGFDEIADSLVVGVEQPDGGYWMPLFVVLAEGARLDDGLLTKLRSAIRSQLSPRHVPDEVVAAPAVPRTLTGKKLEVPVKRILQGVAPEDAAATGSIEDPEALRWYARFARRRGGVASSRAGLQEA